jgi:hypothetical protein
VDEEVIMREKRQQLERKMAIIEVSDSVRSYVPEKDILMLKLATKEQIAIAIQSGVVARNESGDLFYTNKPITPALWHRL